jgi:hypothetical protein
MQFFFLLLLNVFMGAVLYLIISLKLEKSAAEFREQKLRKEMESVIHEFNATAERNISILENKIKILRRLLEKSGAIKLLDITIDEKERDTEDASFLKKPAVRTEHAEDKKVSDAAENHPEFSIGYKRGAPAVKKGLLILLKKIMKILPSTETKDAVVNSGNGYHLFEMKDEARASRPGFDGGDPYREQIIMQDPPQPVYNGEAVKAGSCALSDEEIQRLVSLAGDRYSLVSVLHSKGCSVEDISQHSGIPVGEVRLVLNLNNSR